MKPCEDCKGAANTNGRPKPKGTPILCASCWRKRMLAAREPKPANPGTLLPRHLQPQFSPMSRSRRGGKGREFY